MFFHFIFENGKEPHPVDSEVIDKDNPHPVDSDVPDKDNPLCK